MNPIMRELLRSMVISWDIGEVGAPTVDPLIPYGSNDLVDDVKRISGVAEEEDAMSLHRETEFALLEFIEPAELGAGWYTYSNLLRETEDNGISIG